METHLRNERNKEGLDLLLFVVKLFLITIFYMGHEFFSKEDLFCFENTNKVNHLKNAYNLKENSTTINRQNFDIFALKFSKIYL